MKFSDLNKKKNNIITEKKELAVPRPVKEQTPPLIKEKESAKQDKDLDAKEEPVIEKKETNVSDVKQSTGTVPIRGQSLSKQEEELSPEKLESKIRDMSYVYSETLKTSKDLLRIIDSPYVEKYDKLKLTCTRNCEILQNNDCLGDFLHYATAENYLFAHTANVSLISQAMGFELNLDKFTIIHLGICALLHDIGMTDFMDLIRKETKLNEHEFYEIRKHSEIGAEKLDRIVDIDYGMKDRIKNVIYQIHERIDGSGYPRNLSILEIDFLAQIIGVADVYEALTHPRSWRKSFHPHNAIKYLIEHEGKDFEPKIVKSLIRILSIYPPGSILQLSTGEIARVVRINKNSLTRPKVEIILNADFSPVPPQMIDLAKYPLTSIKDIVTDEELSRKNNKFFAQLELSKWITDW